MPIESNGKAMTLSVLKRAVREIEAGYVPDFLVIMYPRCDSRVIDQIVGLSTDDLGAAKMLSNQLSNMQEQFQKQFVLAHLGLGEEEFESTMGKLVKDLNNVMDRAFDSLKKEPPVKDTSEAEKLLRELMEKKS